MTTHKSAKVPAPTCPFCKTTHRTGKEAPPTGICSHCQTKIGVVILIIMVITTGMIFFGIF